MHLKFKCTMKRILAPLHPFSFQPRLHFYAPSEGYILVGHIYFLLFEALSRVAIYNSSCKNFRGFVWMELLTWTDWCTKIEHVYVSSWENKAKLSIDAQSVFYMHVRLRRNGRRPTWWGFIFKKGFFFDCNLLRLIHIFTKKSKAQILASCTRWVFKHKYNDGLEL
jgi:hypothetical protein